mgnify:FL=1
MYALYQKGRRVWGVGMTPKRAIEEAENHGAKFTPMKISLLPSNSIVNGTFCMRPCSLEFRNWYVNTLYPDEDTVWKEINGRLQMIDEEEKR